jgi:crotonobetainyl-CoA:carnitine CoA-transferase CaiB-like acyl-CoA transferase
MQAGVPCACVNNFKQVFDDPHMIDRGIVKDTEHPQLGPMRAVRNPILLDHDGPSIERPAPMLGQHSREILRDLGYSDATISGYFEAGVTAERQAKSPPAEAAE